MGMHERALRSMRLRRAMRWISDRLEDKPDASFGLLVDEAGRQFGLSPRQEEFLYRLHALGPGLIRSEASRQSTTG